MNRTWLIATILLSSITNQIATADEPVESLDEKPIADNDREYWAFQSLNFDLPGDEGSRPVENPVDLFTDKQLHRFNLERMPPASRSVLLRRLKLTLLGLHPHAAEVSAFLFDERHDAYERRLQQYLASPLYGERQALFWLDLARFAETDGFEHDNIRNEAWKFRDWVISAMNSDMPYDEFIHQQLAGDEIAPHDPQAAIATMFCLSGPDMPDINSQLERRHQLLNELTSTIGATLLGMQIGCAQCHAHKYDPISQQDFYRLRAVFQPAVHVTKNKSVDRLREKRLDEKSFLMIRGDHTRQGEPLQPAVPRVMAHDWMPIIDYPADSPTTGRRSALARWLTTENQALTARVIVNRLWQHCFGQGLVPTPNDFGAMGARPTNPELLDFLAAKLINSSWSIKQLYYQILTSATFRQAARASDCENGREAQDIFSVSVKGDVLNQHLSRFPSRRLDGEAIRDCLLRCAGELNLQMGGPGVRPPLQPEISKTLLKGQWEVTPDKSQHTRRSIYIFARRNLRHPFFEVFDRPDANVSCPVRQTSATPPQALMLFNSRLPLESARRFAGRILKSATDDKSFIIQAFAETLSRDPADHELEASIAFLNQQRAEIQKQSGKSGKSLPLASPTPMAMSDVDSTSCTHYCLVLFNLLEFCYIP